MKIMSLHIVHVFYSVTVGNLLNGRPIQMLIHVLNNSLPDLVPSSLDSYSCTA